MCDKKINCHIKFGYPEKRWLQFLILRIVCEKPTYGYNIIKAIEDITNGRHTVKTGTMYTTLRRMEKEDLLKSDWKENKSGPDSRVYQITKKGREYLKNWLEMVIERKKMIDKMADFYDAHFRRNKK